MTVLIVEDDLPAQRRLVRLLRAHPEYRDACVVCADDVTEARRVLASEAVKLVLLDLDLHGDDGFGVLSAASTAGTMVVVVSANTHRALRAFDVGVVDFVAKPVNAARLMIALGRVQPDAIRRRPAALIVRSRHGLERVSVEDVLYISGADDYVAVTLMSGRRLLHDEPIAHLERQLPSDFLRVHRSHIVRRDSVRRVLDGPGGTRIIELRNGARVPVSRRRVALVLRTLLRAMAP
ncbi:MAG: response regulator transcription factor [Gemmatimonadaceae bacterium]|nr:response regulator transcription factor [Gemmatimonadaceae bacterium]